MKQSICIEMIFTEYPFEDRFRLAKEAGFDFVEFWTWKDKDLAEIKALCRVYDLKIASFSGDQDFSMIDDEQKDDYISFAEKSIEAAGSLDCKNLVVHSNALGENGVVVDDYSRLDNSRKSSAISERLATLSPIAEKAGVTLVLEALNTRVDHVGNFLTSTKEASALIRDINSPFIKVLFDIYHMQIMGENISETLKDCIDAIGYIHIADAPGRHEPGTGEIDYGRIFNSLRAMNYEGVIGFELIPSSDSDAAILAIKDLIKK